MSRPLFTSFRRPLVSTSRSSVHFRPVPSIRHASSTPSAPRRFISSTLFIATGFFLAEYYYDSRSLLHEHVVMPLVRLGLDPEQGHKLAIRLLSMDKWARPRDKGVDDASLQTELFGQRISNPIGIAAGFDKDAVAIDGLFDLGFGYVEVGSVTPEPQPGNPKPRFFRLEEDSAAINRYGFNSLGHGHTLAQLRSRLVSFAKSHPSLFPSPLPLNPLPPADIPRSLRPGQLLAVNLGKNKTSPADSNEDYIKGVKLLGPYADVIVINVSSPNTPGLRALQGREILKGLLSDVVKTRNDLKNQNGLPKIAVKVASDLSEDELADVAYAVRSSGVEGVIVSNTTIRRKELGLTSSYQDEVGGLSGKPLFPYALESVKTLRPLLPPSIPLIGCGGVSTGEDALEMARAGASLVQVYTSFGYRGVGTARLIKDEITSSLSQSQSKWTGEIGKSWGNSNMGWDENRLKNDAEKLKNEAKNLGDLLNKINEKEDLQSLIAQAELAIGKPKDASSAKTTSESEKDGARDNLAGSTSTPQSTVKGDDVASGLLESGIANTEQIRNTQDRAIENTSTPSSPTAQEDVGASSIQEALLTTPIPIDLTPQIVVDQPVVTEVTVDERENQWTQSVRSGQRRLV
ncbi:dihydroorotate dehydrogenase (fumarate) [Kwoniella pini CBS 10737]|uniref:Dihydroorotate dehydrogenase (quinone), mitochondrial n=1 Tax=Kwoniella pini CBS 10737 TaxID=1296096 RepID=A0A1B9IDE4_9TREE|nr:dihydroorotate dehydrogenase (fumarate) [Kwoniella pini CBS 10737]OCF53566.1 dihydroorotate dehydrogenase (fumarate) [Kwoniella pini CBS 10737]